MDNKQIVGEIKSEESAVTSKKSSECQHFDVRTLQTVTVVWLDKYFGESNEDYQNSIVQLYRNINIFTDNDKCLEFIRDIDHTNVCMIISGSIGKSLVPCVHDIHQLDSIYVYCDNKEHHEQWTKQWSKIKGVFSDITSICEALRQRTRRCQQNAISMSFIGSKKRLDQLDPSFMYTQIIKEIMLTIHFENKHIKEFINYCPDVFGTNKKEPYDVEQLLRQYHKESPIWWYTNPNTCLYSMLNSALRLVDGNIIVRMGFFIKELHQHIEQLHKQQFGTNYDGEIFTCYRGQGLSKRDFDEMTKSKGGLMSFNSFLSTSREHDVSLFFAESNLENPDLIAVLFVINIDSKQSTVPFASIRGISTIPDEDELLFSMHSVFHIDDIKQMNENNRFYEVGLTLTGDNDKELNALTEQVRADIPIGTNGWHRLGFVLMQLHQNEMAEEIYKMLLGERKTHDEKALIYNILGSIKKNQGETEGAIEYYEKSIAISQQSLPPFNPYLASSYNNISSEYARMNLYPKALSYCEKALAIWKLYLDPNDPAIAAAYHNIGWLYVHMDRYSEALSFFEKAVAIQAKSLPLNHPDLAATYSNIGTVHKKWVTTHMHFCSMKKVLKFNKNHFFPRILI
ncbi:unnamed protein product [Adineta ricciae]|uniref:ADP ribosyltransferase domain-containing protein n=1 Tax=Adineta ricciae TaxID=249248 RepID=A0A815MDF0_ADIRI|nr:unnamed protein product [Adineta ricciae]CAF1425679.1 unnamed protein product [Adineta ricciae]